MAKNPSNGNVKVGWILDSALTEKTFPLATTISSSALDLSAAISWKNYKVGADNSADIDDRALTDLGNAVTAGAAKYGAALSFFRDSDNTDTTSIYQQAFEAFRSQTSTLGWLVVRVNKAASLPWAAGDEVSLYKLLADTQADETSGEESTKFTVTFLAQGDLKVHTMLGGAGVITGIAATATPSIADGPFQLQPIAGGASIVSRATYASSDLSVATVSKGGTVTLHGSASDTATITVSYGATTAPVVQALTLAA